MTYDLKKLEALLPGTGAFSASGMCYFDEIESTNSWLLGEDNAAGRFCLALNQTRGKGRREKLWVSSATGSLLLSMGWNLNCVATGGLSLVSGLAVLSALHQQGVRGLRLKWPNDIVVNDKKLGGILVEISASNVVVGVGLNINLSDVVNNAGAPRIEQPWTDLAQLGVSVDRELLVAAVIHKHRQLFEQYKERGFSVFKDQWNSWDAYRNQQVKVFNGNNMISGVSRGVSETGALILETDGENIEVVSGEVSVRIDIQPSV